MLGSNYERLTLRVNTKFNVRKWLRIGENLSFATSRSRNAMNNNASPQASVLSAALAMAPWDPVYYPENAVNGLGEKIGGQPSAASNFTNVVNPMSMIYNTEPNNRVQRWVGDIFIGNNMDRTFNYAYRYSNADYREHNSVGAGMARYMTLTNDNVITYARDIEKHSFSVMAGETMQQYDYYSVSAGGQDIVNIDPKNWYIFNTKKDSTRTEGDAVARTRRLSFFTRLHYSYDNRYIATFNFRADASSRFKKSDKGVWGYFPSMALAWRINQEAFLEDADYIDNLKLRFGWGQVGNDQVSESAFVQSIDASLSDRVIHLSVEQGDGFGYDIALYNPAENKIYLYEVKTTSVEEFFNDTTLNQFESRICNLLKDKPDHEYHIIKILVGNEVRMIDINDKTQEVSNLCNSVETYKVLKNTNTTLNTYMTIKN